MLALSGMASAASTTGATTGALASGSVAPTAPVTPAAVAPTGPVAPMTGPRIIEVLDQTIDWYRTLGVQQQAADEPRDLLILFDNRQTANQVIGLAFDIARADAEILAKQPPPKNIDAGGSPQTQTLAQLQDKFTAQGVAAQQELDSNQNQLAGARAQRKIELRAKISELQGEIDLINARKSLLATMSTFASRTDGSGFSASALKAQIDAMAVTAPATGTAGAAIRPPALRAAAMQPPSRLPAPRPGSDLGSHRRCGPALGKNRDHRCSRWADRGPADHFLSDTRAARR